MEKMELSCSQNKNKGSVSPKFDLTLKIVLTWD